MAHAPGPWHVVRHNHVDDELWLSVNQHADAQGMQEWIAEIKYLATDPERQWANARLLSAAPELLAVAKALFGRMQDAEGSDAMYADVEAAIAKAEGADPIDPRRV